MKVANLVKCLEYPQSGWLGLTMELTPGNYHSAGEPGFWVEWFEDRENWVWYKLNDYSDDVEVINESTGW
jgi:hypothetical protein